jgi:hypothetical protein
MLAQNDAVLYSKLEKFRKDQTALAKAMTLPPSGGA